MLSSVAPSGSSVVAIALQTKRRIHQFLRIAPLKRSRQRDKSAASSSTLPLSAEPKADDPAGASRFGSKTGPYALTAVRGTLKAKINGQDVSTAFIGAR